ncbi:cellulose biosynthesis cyclic di-GMP-binding regulatory protein BcsB [Chromobacterium alticapitis]|uniref:Cyclic di-GMP-binding protein n=1 Tax=Chromobacterium alticapitis TaxID=2073169 RepID=A0A2S5DIQ2_9NEIS|nr:cellulose biosynthesis cyclic di-GMP-binding regulatory protein BcsB [Chromobacterium alticapitis]POZ62891.1 hypothetical protein C2I19_06130 [Chromobacterium alticapitis]
MGAAKRLLWLLALFSALWAAPCRAADDASAPQGEAAPAPWISTRTLSFKQIGIHAPLKLRGGNSVATVSFGSRTDELVTGITLHLRYTFSPALLTDLSHIQVMLNDEIVTVLPFAKGDGGKQLEATLTLNPRLLADFNRLQFRLIGHYTNRCENEAHSSIWAEISNFSDMKLTVQALTLADDLTFFPEPFFDKRDFSVLKLPMVFGARPSLGALRAAGELASWFGAQASWRGALFQASLDKLPPEQHAIVFASNEDRPSFLASLPPAQGPMLAVMPHPLRPERKLLLVLGRDDADLQLAVRAMVLGQAGMTGSLVSVRQVKLVAPRLPYDAPNWVSSARPTRLGDLVTQQQDLEVVGQQLAPIKVSFRVPADLFTWGSRGIPLNLKFRYTGPQKASDSRLNIGINDFFVQSLALKASGIGGVETSLRLPVLENGLLSNIDQILLPPFRVSSRSEMQFQFTFAADKQGECSGGLVDNNRAEIDPDSTIDFSQYPHYAEMPNLALFANSAFPFSRLADLSDTVVAMPPQPAREDIGAYLSTLGFIGAATGFPALRFRLVGEEQLTPGLDADLLIIGDSKRLKLLQAWRKLLPTVLDGDNRRVADGLNEPQERELSLKLLSKRDNPVSGVADFTARGKVAALLGLESPLKQGRSAIIVTATSAEAMGEVSDALSDDAKLAQMSGSVALLRGDAVDSERLGPVYHVGSLPLWAWLWLYLSGHPLLLAGLSAFAVLIAALAILRIFRMLAARRLRE